MHRKTQKYTLVNSLCFQGKPSFSDSAVPGERAKPEDLATRSPDELVEVADREQGLGSLGGVRDIRARYR